MVYPSSGAFPSPGTYAHVPEFGISVLNPILEPNLVNKITPVLSSGGVPQFSTGLFFKTNHNGEWSFVRGAARLLIAPLDTEFPTEIDDIIQLASGWSQYDPKNGWEELGATKDGIQIATNHSPGPIQINRTTLQTERVPDKWHCNIKTSFAEVTLEHLKIAWQGGSITQSTPTGGVFDERRIGFGTFHKKIKRRLAVLFKDNRYNLVRAFVFRGVVISPQQSEFSYNKTGPQTTIPVTLDAKPEKSVSKLSDRFFTVYEQTLS